jgi:DNA repair ATPase RecN
MRVGVLAGDEPVIRFKQAKKQGYLIGETEYVAVGTLQPTEVAQRLQLSEINFQGQHDAPFLLGMTPGQIAKEINKIVDLSAIDEIQTKAKSKTSQVKTVVAELEPQVKQAKEEAEALKWVEQATIDFVKLDVDFAEWQATGEYILLGQSFVDGLATADTQLGEMLLVLKPLERHVTESADREASLTALNAQISPLQRLLTTIETTEALTWEPACIDVLEGLVGMSEGLSEILRQGKGLSEVVKELGKVESDLGEADTIHGAAAKLVVPLTHADLVLDDVKTLTSILAELALVEEQVEEAEAELTKKEKESKLCPMCKRPL